MRLDRVASVVVDPRCLEVFATLPDPAGTSPARHMVELTDREADVLRLVATGLSNADIAARLRIGPATVKTYVSRLLTKIAVTDRIQLVIYAYESGLIARQAGTSGV